jgi:hypothetical protein
MNITAAEQRRDVAVLRALVQLEGEPGIPFQTTRVAIAVESGLRPLTMDCSMYRLVRDGYVYRQAKRGTGTTIQILRRPA